MFGAIDSAEKLKSWGGRMSRNKGKILKVMDYNVMFITSNRDNSR